RTEVAHGLAVGGADAGHGVELVGHRPVRAGRDRPAAAVPGLGQGDGPEHAVARPDRHASGRTHATDALQNAVVAGTGARGPRPGLPVPGLDQGRETGRRVTVEVTDRLAAS